MQCDHIVLILIQKNTSSNTYYVKKYKKTKIQKNKKQKQHEVNTICLRKFQPWPYSADPDTKEHKNKHISCKIKKNKQKQKQHEIHTMCFRKLQPWPYSANPDTKEHTYYVKK